MKICPVCQSKEISPFVTIPQAPVHCNLLWPLRDEALKAPKRDIELAFCRCCAHIFNLAFDPELMAYTQAYENPLHFSPRFQAYAESLAMRLVERYDLRDKVIVELGSGKGDFLKLICRLGDNRGFGFDPSYVPEPGDDTTEERVTFIQDFYSERYAGYKADLVCSRHVLEHMQDPLGLLGVIGRALGDHREAIVFFEVPNASFTLRNLAIWDIIYEHCSYYSALSLSCLLARSGFEVMAVSETYEGQFLCIEAWPAPGLTEFTCAQGAGLDQIAQQVDAFAQRYQEKVENWQRYLNQMMTNGQRIVVWGSGSKGVTFLNTLPTQAKIRYVVDINPRKQGMYVVGTGQQIVPPTFLADYQPDVIILMNAIYEHEVRQLTNSMNLQIEFAHA